MAVLLLRTGRRLAFSSLVMGAFCTDKKSLRVRAVHLAELDVK